LSSGLANLWSDLRRRRVFNVAGIYAAVAWVTIQVADVIGPAVNMPDRVMTAIVGFAMIGFPIAIVLAWLFDVGPEGVVRTRPGSSTGVFAIVVSLGLLGAGTAGFVSIIKSGQQPDGVVFDFDPLANSIAVLPFVDLSPNKDSGHFTDGIAQVLIHQLSSIAKLRVIARDSSFAFKGEDTDIRSIARKLRTERILTGSVQRSGDRLRISTQLIDARTGESVWSELFDREGKDIFAIQDEIALAVAEKMDAPLEPAVQERVTKVITEDIGAYDLYFQGLDVLWNSPYEYGFGEATEYFKQAVALDPDLALAWVVLSSVTYWDTSNGYIPRDEGLAKSREYLAMALAIDPELSEAHAQAILFAGRDRDFEAARRSFNKAVESGPSNWRAYKMFGDVLSQRGRHAEAIEVLSKGLELNPYRPEPLLRVRLGHSFIKLGQYEKGMRLLAANYAENRGAALEAQHLRHLAGAARSAGRYDEAVAAYEIALADDRESLLILSHLAQVLLAIGDLDAAAEKVDRAEVIVTQQRAAGRAMNNDFANVEEARLMLDIATNKLNNIQATANRFLKDADEGTEGAWTSNRFFEAGIRCIILGRFADAARMMDRFIVDVPDPENFAFAAFAQEKAGNSEKARVYLEEGRVAVDELMQDRYPSIGPLEWVAKFLAVDGRIDEAIENLQRMYELGYRDHAYLGYMPLFDSLRNDPRFIELIQKMRADTKVMRKRVEAARATGDWDSIIARHFEI
jgi:TolB-like protein/tetratricopeptide (TPR) repeat protein